MDMNEAREGRRGGLWWWRAWITEALAKRRKERVKGRTRMEEVMVWESLRLRMVKNCEEGGKAAASKRDRRRW